MSEIHAQQGVDNIWWSLGFCDKNIQLNYVNENKRDHVKGNYISTNLIFIFLISSILTHLVYFHFSLKTTTSRSTSIVVHYGAWPRILKCDVDFPLVMALGPPTVTMRNHESWKWSQAANRPFIKPREESKKGLLHMGLRLKLGADSACSFYT